MMKILVGYDGSNASKEALNLSVEHAKAFRAEIIVITSRQSGETAEVKSIRQDEKDLEEVKQLFEKSAISCETHLLIRGLSPGEDIVSFAKEQNVNAVIIGVKRRSRVGKALFGSNAQHIILNAPCPVTTVR
jgi:nucleotide-binding universal stress UspA family protein